MTPEQEPSSAARGDEGADTVSEADLERVLKQVPRGTLALTGAAVAILLIAWLIVYFGIFLPRGAIN